jgi:simple sugar transport system ATP-binding protein
MQEKQQAPATIRLQGISKSFGQVQANKEISFDIRPGKIKALLGENGAGKSTLMSILAGRFQPDSGSIFVNGQSRIFTSTKDAIQAGIGMVYQHFMLVEAMTVAENIFLGQFDSFLMHPRKMQEYVKSLGERFGLEINPKARVADLSMGEKQRVEILKLLHRESQVLILDEPTTVLTPKETSQLFEALWQMAAQGKSIVFITHKLVEVLAVAEEIAVLRRGEIVAETTCEEITSKQELAQLMVGRDVLLHMDKKPLAKGSEVLKTSNLQADNLYGVSLEVSQGEILGIVGVAGNGQKPLVQTICGLAPPKGGKVSILDRDWTEFFASEKLRKYLSYIPEDRLGLATCPDLDILDNFLLTTREEFSKKGWMEKKRPQNDLQDLISRYNVHCASLSQSASQLSGGNLQKLVLAREFYRQPKLVVAEQPSQGLDIAATEEVWKYLLFMRKQAGILLITGDLNEALNLSDRIAVMYKGKIADTFMATDKEKVNNIGMLMAGL